MPTGSVRCVSGDTSLTGAMMARSSSQLFQSTGTKRPSSYTRKRMDWPGLTFTIDLLVQ